jgi:hypothetical protein
MNHSVHVLCDQHDVLKAMHPARKPFPSLKDFVACPECDRYFSPPHGYFFLFSQRSEQLDPTTRNCNECPDPKCNTGFPNSMGIVRADDGTISWHCFDCNKDVRPVEPTFR